MDLKQLSFRQKKHSNLLWFGNYKFSISGGATEIIPSLDLGGIYFSNVPDISPGKRPQFFNSLTQIFFFLMVACKTVPWSIVKVQTYQQHQPCDIFSHISCIATFCACSERVVEQEHNAAEQRKR